MKRVGLALSASIFLAGCLSAEGPRQIIRSSGVLVRPNSETSSLVTRFSNAAHNAFPAQPTDQTPALLEGTRTQRIETTQSDTVRPPDRDRTVRTERDGTRVVTLTNREVREREVTIRDVTETELRPRTDRIVVSQDTIREFLDSGFALVYSNCDDYFWLMGQNQTGTRVARDAVAPIVSLLAGLIPLGVLTGNADRAQNLIEGLALGSAFATSALDVYDSHFLFGVENIDSVRTLTQNALGTHRSAVAGLTIANSYQAAMHLIDHQAICTPAHILALARVAIAKGDVQATISGGGTGRRDLDFRLSLGNALGLSGPVSSNQAFALWWLMEFENDLGDKDKSWIVDALSRLPADAQPLQASGPSNFVPNPSFSAARRAEVLERLASTPPTTRQTYLSNIVDVRADIASQPVGAVAGGPTSRPLVVPEGGDGYQRVGVSIRD